MFYAVIFLAFSILAAALAGGGWVMLQRANRRMAADLATDLADRQSQEARQALDVALAELREQSAQANEAGVQRAVSTVLDVAGDKLADQSKAGSVELEQRNQEISRHLDDLRRLVGDLQKEKSAQHGELVSRLDESGQRHRELVSVTGELREALASPKARGNWGERTAADVLRIAGFTEGIQYRRATMIEAGTVPDFTFLLPHDRVVHMDVKFPISNYLRVLSAETDEEISQFTKAFLRDVRTRVSEITDRGYIDPGQTLDNVLLFIPNESVYSFIHEHDAELIDRTLKQRVVLCSPFTLFAVLGVMRQAMDNFMVEETSREVLDCLGRFTAEWDKYNEAIDSVGRGLQTASNQFDKLAGTRRRQMQKRVDQVDELRQRYLSGDAEARIDLTTQGELTIADVAPLAESDGPESDLPASDPSASDRSRSEVSEPRAS